MATERAPGRIRSALDKTFAWVFCAACFLPLVWVFRGISEDRVLISWAACGHPRGLLPGDNITDMADAIRKQVAEDPEFYPKKCAEAREARKRADAYRRRQIVGDPFLPPSRKVADDEWIDALRRCKEAAQEAVDRLPEDEPLRDGEKLDTLAAIGSACAIPK